MPPPPPVTTDGAPLRSVCAPERAAEDDRGRRSFSTPAAPRKAGQGSEKTARPRRSAGPSNVALSCASPPPALPHDRRQAGTRRRWRAACVPDANRGHGGPTRSVASGAHAQSPNRPQRASRGGGGHARRRAIQQPMLAGDGLEGAARPSISMHIASTGFAIGRGSAPGRSHANLETAGGEFA
jgi:hypothetical protein